MALKPVAGNACGSLAASRNLKPFPGCHLGKENAKADKLLRHAAVLTETSLPKRPYSAVEEASDSADVSDSASPITESCDAIRQKIKTLTTTGGMKAKHFRRSCNINSSAYSRFMKLSGPNAGENNKTYAAASRFFQQLEEAEQRKKAEIKEPIKKRVRRGEESRTLDVSGVELEGEEDESVPIFDTCDEVRRKIAAYLREPDVTQAAFLRALPKMFPNQTIKFQSGQLKDFLSKKGPLAGNTSRVYYASYVFFEKQRILHEKPKTKKREENEDVWAWRGGIDRKRQGAVIVSVFSTPYIDKWGQTRCR